MTSFILRRIVHAIPVLIGITCVAFLLVHLIPGDPARIFLGAQANPEAVATLRDQLGLNRSLLTQYVDFVSGSVRLDFGDSISQQSSVTSILAARIPVTLLMLAYSVLLSIVIAVPLAIVSALRRNRAPDHT